MADTPARIIVPWTRAQIDALQEHQTAGVFHPYTCGNDHGGESVLTPTREGWVCPHPGCDYRQTWAWKMTLRIGQSVDAPDP